MIFTPFDVIAHADLLTANCNSCCRSIEIFCPCSSQELEILVKFLYYGKIFYAKSKDNVKTLQNLSKIGNFVNHIFNGKARTRKAQKATWERKAEKEKEKKEKSE